MAEQQATAKLAAAPKADDELARLRTENAALKAQLALSGQQPRVAAPQHTFQLSEGDRQELEIRGVVNIGGRMWTRDEALAAMADGSQSGVEIAEAPEGTRVDLDAMPGITGPGVRGVDYIWPSVERGKIDPAVAGTPGINGPSADEKAKA
jgi:hypothetical protein